QFFGDVGAVMFLHGLRHIVLGGQQGHLLQPAAEGFYHFADYRLVGRQVRRITVVVAVVIGGRAWAALGAAGGQQQAKEYQDQYSSWPTHAYHLQNRSGQLPSDLSTQGRPGGSRTPRAGGAPWARRGCCGPLIGRRLI